jgi:hypothetical protein
VGCCELNDKPAQKEKGLNIAEKISKGPRVSVTSDSYKDNPLSVKLIILATKKIKVRDQEIFQVKYMFFILFL